MKSLLSNLHLKFYKAILEAFPELCAQAIPVEVTPSTQAKFGHYQCNTPMKLSKELKQSPRQIAEKIVPYVDRSDSLIADMEIAGPGFINISLHPLALSQQVQVLLEDPHFGIDSLISHEKIIIDFSSPNIAKEMHVGHLRSTIIGESLARLFEFLGYSVLRLNHVGDWGTAFGMLIAYIKENKSSFLEEQHAVNLSDLVMWYKASKKKFDENIEFKKCSHAEVVELQQGNPNSLYIWNIICAISRKAFQEIYDVLDIHLHERGESFYNTYLKDIVSDLERKGLVQVSDGAKCIFLEGFQNREGELLPLIIQKSDGGYNYDTTDMAAIYHRVQIEKGDRLIYVTDAGQCTHFQMIFKAAELAGYTNSHVRVDHVPFGLVLGADGKKFRTRSGETERLIDLLDAAVKQANKILLQRDPAMDEHERKKLASVLGISAVKYADLSNHRIHDYTFSYERMLRFDGNTAVFLLYAYVRIAGIKRKVKIDVSTLLPHTKILLEHATEIDLGLHLLRFQETLHSIAHDLLPHHLTDYLFTLAEKFNAFFRDCRVEGTPQQNTRLLLCESTARVLKQGLYILGIPVIDRM